MDGESPPRKVTDVGPEQAKSKWDRLFSRVVLAWLALGGGAVALGLYAVSASQVTNRTLLLAVVLAGGGGGCISATAALVSYLGERAFRASWTAYFLFRPILGAAIAVLFYLAVRGGLISANAPPSVLNYYGVLTISLLVGLSSKSILDRILTGYDVAFGRGARLISGVGAGYSPSPPIGQLDAYRGYIVRNFVRVPGSGSWLLRVWLQNNRPEELPSQLLQVGEGPRADAVRFRFTVFQHDYRVVVPQTATVLVRTSEERSEAVTFQFDDHGESASPPPTALIEVSQRGRTVAVLGTDEAASRLE